MKPLELKVATGITQAFSAADLPEWAGESLTPNFLPWLKGVGESLSLPCRVSLSSVLERGPVHPKYYLSAEQAVSMLERAEKKGKPLPPLYMAVLLKVAFGTRGIAGDLAARATMKDGDRVALAFDGFNRSLSQELHHTLRVGRDSGDAVVVLIATSEVAGTLTPYNSNGFLSNGLPNHGLAIEGDRVRVLTPREWERLMGFPDDFTLVPYRNNGLAADSPRYEALGNAIAMPILGWLGQRFDQAFAADPMPGPQEAGRK